jgi:hypothetical protein
MIEWASQPANRCLTSIKNIFSAEMLSGKPARAFNRGGTLEKGNSISPFGFK